MKNLTEVKNLIEQGLEVLEMVFNFGDDLLNKDINKLEKKYVYDLKYEEKKDGQGKYYLLTFAKSKKITEKPEQEQLPFLFQNDPEIKTV